MSTATKTLKQLLDHIEAGELILPEIQRDFVWPKRNVKLLFDSLYRGMPIGHMLVWKAKKVVGGKRFAGQKKSPATNHLHSFYGYLLDGQQRLTALKRVLERDDDFPLLFYLYPEVEAEEDVFWWQRPWNEDDPWYVSVADVLSPRFKPLECIDTLKGDEYYKDSHAEIILNALTRLQQILSYDIGITEYETDEYREAMNLFIRFNSTGRKLNKNDLAMAELALKVRGLGGDAIARTMHRWERFSFTRPFLVQCLLAVLTSRLQLRDAHGVWDEFDEKQIRQAWNRTERGLSEVISLVTGTIRWDSSDWLPSFNALVPLIVVMAHAKTPGAADRELARRWLILVTLHRYFSGSVHTVLDQLLRRLQKAQSIRHLWSVTKGRLRRVRPEHFETGRLSGPVMSMFVSMLRNNDARDWLTNEPLDGSVLGHNASLTIHHFFPRSLLKKHGYAIDDINTFANYTLLLFKGNLDAGTEEPATYMARCDIPERQLRIQCIPLDKALWRVDRYEDFLTERRKLLAQCANDFLGI